MKCFGKNRKCFGAITTQSNQTSTNTLCIESSTFRKETLTKS